MNVVTPKHLYDYLNQHVIGQEEAKKYISVAVYNHINVSVIQYMAIHKERKITLMRM
jgi:ATP-dependent protease Clp ATPase subunit